MKFNSLCKLICAFVFALYLFGCAATKSPMGNIEGTLKQFNFSNEISRIYIYRASPGFIALGGNHKVFVDGIPLGTLEEGEFMVADVAPGAHKVISIWNPSLILPNSTRQFPFELIAGKWYWLNLARVEFGSGRISSRQAISEISKLKLAAFNDSNSASYLLKQRTTFKAKLIKKIEKEEKPPVESPIVREQNRSHQGLLWRK